MVFQTRSPRNTSTVTSSFPPKPPPMYGAMIRTREWGSPSTLATSRKCSMTWVATRIVITPFSSSQRDAGLGLDEGVVDERRPVAPLHDDVGLAEARLHVALADLPARDDVPRRLEPGRIGPHRRLGVEDAGEIRVLDGHPAGRLLRRLLGLRRHQRDGLAEEAHDLLREHLGPRAEGPHRRRLAGDVAEEDVVGDVPRRENAPHPGHRLGRARVDPDDPRRRAGRAHDLRVEHARPSRNRRRSA